MKPIPNDKGHCFKHAITYRRAEGCPKCALDRQAAQMALDYAQRRWPNANRVTMPQLMGEIERLKTLRRADDGAEKP